MGDRLIKAVLFDFDGVVMDTEKQYSVFWDEKGAQYLGLAAVFRPAVGL